MNRVAFAMVFVESFWLAGVADAEPSAPAPASAQPALPDETSNACPSTDDTVCGRLFFEAGTRAFERGEFESARRAFEAAEARKPHPVIAYNLAICSARLGKPSAAVQQLEAVLADPKTDQDLRSRAERELRSARQAQVHVELALSDPTLERVELDGVPLPNAQRELVLDPGAHRVRISSGTAIVLDQDLELSPGERIELRVGERSRRIDVVVVPLQRESAPATKPITPAPPARHAHHGLAPAWFYAAVAGSAVLSGLTIWSGLDTQHAYSHYQQQLPTLTQSEADESVRDGHARERRTNWLLTGSLFGAAGSAALGLWFVDFGHARQVAIGPAQLSFTTQF